MKTIDIIVAVRNEESTLEGFVREVRKINFPGYEVMMIFVEDGSSDDTVTLLRKLSHSSKDIAYYSLFNPIGPGLATTFGILNSTADAVILMDVDGSHPFEAVMKMIKSYADGYDIVQGRRISYERKQLYRRIGSKIYFIVFSVFTGENLYKQNVYFRLMNRRAIDLFKKYPKTWFSVRLKNIQKNNFKVSYVNFKADERKDGNSKYNLKRLLSFAYKSSITLTDVSRFVTLNVMLLCALILVYFFVSHFVAFLIFTLGIFNIYYYITLNRIDYLNRIVILEYYNDKDREIIES